MKNQNHAPNGKFKVLSLLSLLLLVFIACSVSTSAADNASTNPFAEDNILDVRTTTGAYENLDEIEGIVSIEDETQSDLESATSLIENINELIAEIEKLLENDVIVQENSSPSIDDSSSEDLPPEQTAQEPEEVDEPSQGQPDNQNSYSAEEAKLVNEIKYGLAKTREKIKNGLKPESVIASMKFTKNFADQLKQLDPDNPWCQTSLDYITRTVTNQIRYGTAKLEKNHSAATAAWLAPWLKAAKDMNLSISKDLMDYSEKILKNNQAPPAPATNQPSLAADQQGGKVLNVPMRNQRTNSVGPAWSCGPTSLGMAMQYLGKNVSSVQLITDCGTNRSGTDHAGMVRGAKKNGFSNAKWVYGESAAWVRRQIDAGKPVVVNVPNHYMVCIGYDHRGYLIFNDPNGGKKLVWSPSHFEANWVHGHAALILQ